MATSVKSSKRDQRFEKPEDVSDLIELIQANEDTLETLILEGNSFGIEVSKEIGNALQMCHKMKHLLFDDMFKSRLKTEIPQALELIFGGVMQSQARIVTLDLNDNAIGPVTMPALIPFLKSETCSDLKVLRLNNCGLGIQGGKMLSTILLHLENLEELIIGRNRLEIDGIRDISESLMKLNKLKRLEIAQNGSKEAGIVALCNAIKVNTDLRIVNLNDNVLRTTFQHLETALHELKMLEVLNLGDCLLKTKGCIAIMNAIKSNCENNQTCYIRQIILNGNEIGGSAFESIASAFEAILKTKATNDTRIQIDLSTNNFGESVIEQLRSRFDDAIDLIVDDDEGSEVEAQDEANESLNKTKDDEVEEEIELTSVEQFITKLESNPNISMQTLCNRFYTCSINGFEMDKKALNERCLMEIDAIIQVCKKKYCPDEANFDLVNSLLVACGMLKSEEKKSSIKENVGTLFALSHVLKHFPSNQKRCVSTFVKNKLDEPDYSQYKINLYSMLFSF